MKTKIIVVSILLLLVAVFVCGCSQFMENIGLVKPPNEEQLSPEKGGTPDGLVKVLIGFKEKPGPAEQAIVKGAGGKIKYTYKLIPAIAASIPEVAIEALKKNPNITNIEFDSEVYALDAELDNSWGVKRIGAGFVHDGNNKGARIKIAIIDTGIDYSHPDLDGNYIGGYDFVNSDDDPMDDDGHGTHVAGIIAAEDNNIGVVGVAPEAKLYALKVLDDTGSGYMSDVVLAIQWATDPNDDGSASDRLDIINMSLGGQKNIFLEWACNLAYLDGLLLVAAAGNGGSVIYPAAYDSVISVSATDRDDALASFSSTGKQVELAAPGVNINSTLPGNEYSGETWSGTSMASPHVAGTAALVWKANPTWSNDEVRTQLQETAEDLGAVGWDSKYGYGLVDADEAAGLGNQPSSEKMHVAKIDMLLKTKGSLVNAIANVIIADKNGVQVGGATVSGHWSDITSDSDSGITNASGQVSLKSDNVKKPSSGTTFTFTVDDVVKYGWTYDSSGQISNSITY
jgi:subtilisin family serine protease